MAATKSNGDRAQYMRFHLNLHEAIKMLTIEERGLLLTWCYDYGDYGELPDDAEFSQASELLRGVYSVFRWNIDDDNAARLRAQENGRKGGRPSKANSSEAEDSQTQ